MIEHVSSKRALGERRATGREDLITVLTGCWMLAGAGLDGRAHVTQELESFFTPWHAVLYSGFAATVAWMTLIASRRRARGESTLRAIPSGYGLAWVGLGMFAVGGIGDLIWHETFGIERAIEATFSPTHLLLFFGVILILSSPLRSAWGRGLRSAPWSAIAATTLVVTIASLAFTYFSPFVFQDAYLSALLPQSTVFQPDLTHQRAGLASLLLTNLILTAPPIVIASRWRLPFGSFVVLWGIPVLGVVVTNEATDYPFILSTAAAALAMELVARFLGASGAARLRMLAACGPLFLWTAYFAGIAIHLELGWEPDLWAGALVWSSAMTLGVAELCLLGRADQPRAAGI